MSRCALQLYQTCLKCAVPFTIRRLLVAILIAEMAIVRMLAKVEIINCAYHLFVTQDG